MQLDLFAHGRDAMLRNDVIAALRRRDAITGRRALAALSAEFPRDSLLAPLEALLNALAAPVERIPDHNGATNALCSMETVVVPAANAVFGPKEARGWL